MGRRRTPGPRAAKSKLAAWLASAEHPDQHALWANLAEGDAIFQAEHRAAVVSVDAAGRYHFR